LVSDILQVGQCSCCYNCEVVIIIADIYAHVKHNS